MSCSVAPLVMCDNHPEDRVVNEDLLEFARAWKAGYTTRVHPSIGRRLNACLMQAGDSPVPLSHHTDARRSSLADLLFIEHAAVFRR